MKVFLVMVVPLVSLLGIYYDIDCSALASFSISFGILLLQVMESAEMTVVMNLPWD